MGASLPFEEERLSCNSSTYQFVTKSLRGLNRTRLLRSKAKALCGTHGLQTIRDFFPNSDILLACGCRRNCHNRKPEDIAAFDAAEHRRQLGRGFPSANGYVVTTVENIREAA